MTDEQRSITGGRVARVAPLVGLAGRTAGEAVAASLRKRRHPDADLTEFHTKQAERYVERLGRSRGVLMKAGQMLSFVTLDTAVEAPYRGIYQAAFARLQDDAPPMPAELAIEVITKELGRPPSAVFAEFDPRPLAAASIGQVHSATLPDGRRVAVKVQYPGVEEAIRADLANTELLATFFQIVFTVVPGLARADVRAIAREVSDRIGEEIDYRVEAAHQQNFADLYRGHPFIRIPEVLPEYSSRRVLTMEFSDGVRYAKALSAEQRLRDVWGEAIFRFLWSNLLTRGLFNADPHPGNYLFHPDGSVTFLDFGCVKRFTAEQTARMAEYTQAAFERDPARLIAAATAMGLFAPDDPPDSAQVLAWLAPSAQPFTAAQPFTYTPEFAAQAMREATAEMSVTRKMRGGSEYTFIARLESGTLAVLSGLRSTGSWRAIRDEYYSGAAPATAYGEMDATHRRARR